jgi:hypothetical protein
MVVKSSERQSSMKLKDNLGDSCPHAYRQRVRDIASFNLASDGKLRSRSAASGVRQCGPQPARLSHSQGRRKFPYGDGEMP